MANGEQVLYLLDSDGKCNTCNKSALNSFVSCFICQEKFHAVGCTVSPGICTQTFLGMYKPLSDKTGANSNRTGNFLFTCDNCITRFETERAATNSDKLATMQNQIDKLGENMSEIKNILLKKNPVNKNIGNDQLQSSLPTTAPAWNPVVGAVTPNVNLDITDDSDFPKEKQSKSILIIEKSDNPKSDSEALIEVETIIVDERIAVKNSYENKNGDTVVVCESEEQRNILQDQISKKTPSVKFKPVNNYLTKTIAVSGFNPYYNNSVLSTIRKQNLFVDNFLKHANTPVENHIKLVEVKPLKHNTKLSQAVFKVSFKLRSLFSRNNDKVLFGMKSVRVYDRIFVKRCYNCQKFGHMQSNCPTPDSKVCARCGGNHDTSDCKSSVLKCVNCCRNNLPHDHAALSIKCLLFIAERERLRNLN